MCERERQRAGEVLAGGVMQVCNYNSAAVLYTKHTHMHFFAWHSFFPHTSPSNLESERKVLEKHAARGKSHIQWLLLNLTHI